MNIREKIKKYITDKRRFTIQIEGYVYYDIMCPDASDPDVFRFICKSNYSALTINEPTMGSPIANTGLEEVVVEYKKIYSVHILDVSDDLMNKFKGS